jgi:hypothetical protein
MRSHRQALGLALLTAVGALTAYVGWLAFTPSRQQSEEAPFARVRVGMTEREVLALLGNPDFSADVEAPWVDGPDPPRPRPDGSFALWQTDQGLVTVWFREGGVVRKTSVVSPASPPPQLERLRQWLGW